jgi:ribonuclease VapC
MVLDSSAILAILLDEPERPSFTRLIEQDPTRLVSAATLVEVMMVMESRKGHLGRLLIARFLDLIAAEIVPVSEDQARRAYNAFSRFGKGRHPAGLNFGDFFPYALAEATGEPLLFKGNDFTRTDITSAA